jgi:hypothetical protein
VEFAGATGESGSDYPGLSDESVRLKWQLKSFHWRPGLGQRRALLQLESQSSGLLQVPNVSVMDIPDMRPVVNETYL